jgi:hypothetical protein
LKTSTSLFAIIVVMACAAFAQDSTAPRGRYVTLPPKVAADAKSLAGTLQTWNGTFTYKGATNHFTMVGTDPKTTNTTTTFTVYMVPLNICVTVSGVKTCFDPSTTQANGKTAIQNVQNSPIFQNQDYNQGGTDIGNTQYEDAYQRANFWTDVMTNTNYHTLLHLVVLPKVTLNVPASKGTIGNPFGTGNVAEVDINYLDALLNSGFPKLKQVNPTNLPLIMTYNTYLTQFGGCCIGGYHSATGNQTYSQFTYINNASTFSADVSALSHELGEWYDDPLITNTQGACGGILENGDPIEGESAPHLYGDYTYALNGFTYHLQDLANLQYFGQTPSTSNNNNWTFQGQNGTLPGLGTIGVCSFGQ